MHRCGVCLSTLADFRVCGRYSGYFAGIDLHLSGNRVFAFCTQEFDVSNGNPTKYVISYGLTFELPTPHNLPADQDIEIGFGQIPRPHHARNIDSACAHCGGA